MQLEPKDEFEKRVFRKSKSTATLRFYRSGHKKFEQFCRYQFKADIPEAAQRVKQGEIDAYKLLDMYVDWLQGQGLRPKTVKGYVQGAKKLLRYQDVSILNELFLEKVTLPTAEEILDEAPTPDEIRLILARCSLRMKALNLVLATSGMRLGEALQLETKDVGFDSKPVRIVIPAAYTKNSRERETYITDEAVTALQTWLESWKARVQTNARGKPQGAESRLFNFEGDVHMAEKGASHVFRRVMRHFPELDRPASKGHRVHKIHFHSFRKFFFTKAVDTLGDHAGHALVGHGFHMDTYYKKSEEEREADYLKLMPKLTVFGGGGEKVDIKTELKREILLNVAGYRQEEVDKMDLTTIKDEDFQKMVRERLLGAMANNGNKQRVVPANQVRDLIKGGWEYVDQLPTGEAIVRLPF